jgi:hypothetical protein
MGAETLSPVMFTKASAKSLGRKAVNLFRIGFVVCGDTETMEMQDCCMLVRGIMKLKQEGECKKILYC